MKTTTTHYKQFTHKNCEYFPCHECADPADFNCLFCYCPLYALGENCGGNFCYLKNGIKDCSNCIIPHSPDGFEYVMERWPLIAEMTKKTQ